MTLDNSKWPNGIKEDAEGSAIFYPLDTNKTNITDVNWPEGHKLISPFVYDENDKLIDFIDTKAIVVTGSDTTTTIPYNHIEVDFSSILEGTLNIDAPNASTKVVKWNRYPADLLPGGYTHVEYLESTGTQYIDTGCTANQDTTIKTRWQFIEVPSYAGIIFSHLGEPPRFGAIYRDNLNRSRFDYGTRMNYASGIIYNIGQVYDIEKRGRYNYVDGVLVCTNQVTDPFESSRIGISAAGSSYNSVFRLYSFVMENNGELKLNLIPALDPTGAPCLFNTVSRKTFYNAGTGDFVTLKVGATTYGLRHVLPDWGKLTPNGLRRLYHAPAGYKGDTYDYAIENGYKQIVEPEMPEDGYWRSEWTETDTQIICNWIETEAPTEENT